ncbi:ABC transporter substrate-binding protein [Pendulispora brunnea]|uniref:ABC transporter substrate-binding protein n=1 Tax=Pendulispora brunnea TaxID=2905690 RepID=A0ABZ2K099_9BACT
MFVRSKCLVFGAAVVVSALIAGCSKDRSAGVPLVKSGKLVTCTHVPFAPFEFERDGKITGFDVDVVELVAQRLGVKVQFVDTSVENLTTGAMLDSNQCDLVAAGLTMTDARRKSVDFSEPYFDAYQALVVKRGTGMTSLDAVKNSAKRVGVQSQTIGEDLAKTKELNLLPFESSDAVLLALRTGRVEAAIVDHPAVQTWMKDSGNIAFQIAAYVDTGEQLGIAVKKGNTKLLTIINEVMAQARTDGTQKRLRDQWFGESLGAVPVTTLAKP